MKIQPNIKTTNIELTADVQEYLQERLAGFDKFISVDAQAIVCDVELARMSGQQSGDVYRAEVNLQLAGDLYRAEAEAESMNAAIDEVKDELTRQLRKGKEKRTDLFRRSAAQVKEWLRFGRG